MAVGPVFFTIAMVLYVCGWLPPRSHRLVLYLLVCLRLPRRGPCAARRSAASGQLFVSAGRVLASPESRGGRLFGLPSAWSRRSSLEPALSTSRPMGSKALIQRLPEAWVPIQRLLFSCGVQALSGWRVCSLLHTTAFVTPSSPRALQKTHTSSAAARCDFLQSSSRQHMHCMQSLSHREGTASSATARRRTPSWAL